MGGVYVVVADLMDAVEHVQEVAFRVEPHPFDAAHDFADDLLLDAGLGLVFQALEVGDQLLVDEGEEVAQFAAFQLLALCACRIGPVLPAIGRGEGRHEGQTQRFRFLLFLGFPFVEDAQEQNPAVVSLIFLQPTDF